MLLSADDSSSRRLDAVVEAVASAHINTITKSSSNTTLLRNSNINVNNTIDNRNVNVVTPSESSTTSEMTLNSTSPTINTKKRIRSLVNRERRRNICLSRHHRNDISDEIVENDNVEDEEEDEDIGQNQNTDESHDEMEEMEHDDDEDDEDENEQNNDKRLIRQGNISSNRRQVRRYDEEDVIICSKCRRHFTIAQFSFFLEHKIARCQDNKIDINLEHDIVINRQHTPLDSSLLAASIADSPLPVNSIPEYGSAINNISTMTTSSLYTFTSSNLNSCKRHNDNINRSTIQQREIGVDTSDINKSFFLIILLKIIL